MLERELSSSPFLLVLDLTSVLKNVDFFVLFFVLKLSRELGLFGFLDIAPELLFLTIG